MFEIGAQAPDFQLKDHNKNDVRLSDHKGMLVLLSFHPLAWTKVCAEQMRSLEKAFEEFTALKTVAYGLSVDSVPSKHAWAKELSIEKTRLLSDFWPHGAVARQYGIFREKEGFSERANLIVDGDMKIVFTKIYEISQLPDINEIIGFIKHRKET